MTQAQRQMVALGSSFAAGPGVPPVIDRRALRSGNNYPHLVAQALGASLVDATVSGATTATILNSPQRTGWHRFPPQIESVGPATDLVTITAGGNDLGYLGAIIGRALLKRLHRARFVGPLVRRVHTPAPLGHVEQASAQTATDGLTRVVEEVRRRAPRARVVLVDYLPIFTEGTAAGPDVPFDFDEIAHFRELAGVLSAAFSEAGRRTGADVLPASEYEQTHGAGTLDPWVFSLRLGRGFSSSFHPTPAGMRAVAGLLVTRLVGSPGSPA